MNKNVVIVIGILIIIIAGYGVYKVVKKAPQPYQAPVAVSKPMTPKNIRGTFKDLLASGKSQQCTYSYTNPTGSSVNGTAEVAGGKMSGEFTTVSSKSKITGHIIDSNGFFYIWTDLSNRGLKLANNIQTPSVTPSVTPSNNQMLDVNQTFTYTCQPWVENDSVFAIPANISFFTTMAPMMPAMGSGSGSGTGPSSYCYACNNIPAGPNRTLCLTRLHCQ